MGLKGVFKSYNLSSNAKISENCLMLKFLYIHSKRKMKQLKVDFDVRLVLKNNLNIRCGRVMADNIAYAKIRKSLLI